MNEIGSSLYIDPEQEKREDLIKKGKEVIPSYMLSSWEKTCQKYDVDSLGWAYNAIEKISNAEKEDALDFLKGGAQENASVLGLVACYTPEGAKYVKETLSSLYGNVEERRLAWYEKIEKFHEEQNKESRNKTQSIGSKVILKTTRQPQINSESFSANTAMNKAEPALDSRERFMERVHDEFSPKDARMIAYAKRISDWVVGDEDEEKRHWRNNNFDTYSAVTDILPKEFGEDTNETIVGLEKWITDNYKYDLNFTKKAYLKTAKKARERGDENKARLAEQSALAIDEKLASPNIEPDWGDPNRGFPTTMEYQEGAEFLHCFDLKSTLLHKRDKTELRLYMHPKPNNLVELIDAFQKKCYERDQRYYFKIATHPRPDNFIIYANYDQAENYLDILKEIEREQPNLFEGMENGYKNPFWGKVNGAPKGVYFGEEPAEKGNSYTGLRGDLFDTAFEKWMKEVYHEVETNDRSGWNKVYLRNGTPTTNRIQFDSPKDIPLAAATRLEELFRQELDRANINPNNMCFNK